MQVQKFYFVELFLSGGFITVSDAGVDFKTQAKKEASVFLISCWIGAS